MERGTLGRLTCFECFLSRNTQDADGMSCQVQKSGEAKRAKTNGNAVEVDLTQDPDDDRGPEVLTISDDDDDDDAAMNGVSLCLTTLFAFS